MTTFRESVRRIVAASVTLGMAALAGSTGQAAANDTEFEISFAARVGTTPLRCGTSYAGIGKTKAAMTPQDFRIYVSNFRLIGRDGTEVPFLLKPDDVWQSDRVALLDFEDATGSCNGNAGTNALVRGRAPAGDYTGLVFEIGVPADINHQDPTVAAPPLNFSALSWPWRYGYKFTTIDMDTGGPAKQRQAGHSSSGFSIHLGSVDCGTGSPKVAPETPCATSNRATYVLSKFDPKRDRVVLDLAALLAETDITVNAPETASGCMSAANDDDCIAIMDRFGLTYRGKPSRGQSFVSAEAAQ